MSLKKASRISIGILILVIISLFIECFILNFKYWTLPKEQRGKLEIGMRDIALHNANYSNGIITVNDNSAYFTIKSKTYISYLNVFSVQPQLNPFNIYLDDNKSHVNPAKRFEVNKNGKPFSSILTNGSSDSVKYYFESMDNNYPLRISLDKIYIDNRFYPNLMRVTFITLTLIIIAYLILYREFAFKKLHTTFLVICILFGSFISISNPFRNSWDESEHFVKSYYLSYGIFDVIEKPPVKLPENFNDLLVNPIPQTFREKVSYIKRFSTNNYSKKEYVNSSAKNYTSIPFLPAAFGIWIARTLSLPFIFTLYFGRIFSLIGYALLCALAIKKAKIGKRLIFIIALMPTSMLVASSYSADSLTIAYALLCTVQFINMLVAPDESVDIKQVAVLTALVILLTACKSTYAPFALLLLAIPYSKFKNKKQSRIYKALSIILCALASIIFVLMSQRFHEISWPVPGINPKGQVLYVLSHPFIYFIRFIKAILENALVYMQFSTIDLAYNGLLDSIWFVIIYALIAAVVIIDYEENCIYLKWFQKLVIFLTVFCSWGLVYTALYVSFTPVAGFRASGLQPRYIKPLIFPIALLFKNNNIKLESKIKETTLNKVIIISMTIVLLVTINHLFVRYCL